jgi:bacteriorhodopsin
MPHPLANSKSGCVALAYILYQLVWEARRHSFALGDDVRKVFFQCGTLTAVLWFLYPIAWGVCEGGNVISPDSEAIFYGILDLLAKPVFGALLIWGHRNIDPARLGLAIKDYEDDPSISTHGHREKAAPAAAATTGATTATTTGHHTNGVGHTNGTNGVTNGTNETTTTV